MKRVLEAVAAQAQQAGGALDGPDRPRQLRGWRTIHEIAVELRFTETARHPEAAVREWLRRQHIATVRRGRFLLVDQFDIDRALRERPSRRVHPRSVANLRRGSTPPRKLSA